jgi:hypothetical protein
LLLALPALLLLRLAAYHSWKYAALEFVGQIKKDKNPHFLLALLLLPLAAFHSWKSAALSS